MIREFALCSRYQRTLFSSSCPSFVLFQHLKASQQSWHVLHKRRLSALSYRCHAATRPDVFPSRIEICPRMKQMFNISKMSLGCRAVQGRRAVTRLDFGKRLCPVFKLCSLPLLSKFHQSKPFIFFIDCVDLFEFINRYRMISQGFRNLNARHTTSV